MRRRLFSISSALSLLLCVATVVLSAVSYFDEGALSADLGESKLVWIRRGEISLMRVRSGSALELAVFLKQNPTYTGPRAFNVATPIGAFSLWWIALGSAILTLPWCIVYALRITRRAQRVLGGLCRDCGYNLTGNTSGICPECGTAVAGKVTMTAGRRVSLPLTLGFYLAAYVSAILVTLMPILRLGMLLSLLLFIAITTVAFVGSFLLIRPHIHAKRWPPYVAAAFIGVTNLLAWIGVLSLDPFWRLILRSIAPLLGRMSFFAGLFAVSSLTSITMLALYRITVDRRHRVSKEVGNEPT